MFIENNCVLDYTPKKYNRLFIAFKFNDTSRVYFSSLNKKRKEVLEEKKLTTLSMIASEKSLAKDWDNEDDSFWASFL